MRRVLITGVSGVGKSTVLGELTARGYETVDTDYSYCSPTPDAEPPGPVARPGWVWNERRMRALLEADRDGALFVAGCVPNQGRFYPDFDHVVLLSAAPETVRRRLSERTGNDYGKAPGELDQAMRDQAEVEPLLRAGADVEIDTDAPLSAVVARLLAETLG